MLWWNVFTAFFNCLLSFIDLLLHWVAFTSETFLSLPIPGMYQRGSLMKMTANLKWNRILEHTIKVSSRSKERECKSERLGETESLPFFSGGFLVSKSPNGLFFLWWIMFLLQATDFPMQRHRPCKGRNCIRSLYAIYTLSFHQNERGHASSRDSLRELLYFFYTMDVNWNHIAYSK